MLSVLQREFDYYLNRQNDLVKTFSGRYLLIRNEQIIGDYDSLIEAVYAGEERFALGTFLVQRCSPGPEDYTQTIPFIQRLSAVGAACV